MGRTPAYRKHTLRDFGFVEVDGKRHRLPGPYNSPESLAAYHELCAKCARGAQVSEPPPPMDGSIMLHELCVRYGEWCRLKANGDGRCDAANNRSAIAKFSRHAPPIRAAEFGTRRLIEYQNVLANSVKPRPKNAPDGYRPEPLSIAYVNTSISRIKGMFKWATLHELVPPAIYHALLTVPEIRPGPSTKATVAKKKKPIDEAHINACLRELSDTVRAMVQVQMLTGVRSRSVCLAQKRQFDRTKRIWLWRPRHKTENSGKELIVPIGPRCQEVLRPFLDRRGPSDYLFVPRDVRNRQSYGEHYKTTTYYTAVMRGQRRANERRKKGSQPIPHWNPHRLRHSLGHAVHDRYGYEAAQTMLGHDSVNVTKLYTARRVSLAVKIAEEIG